LYLPKEWTDDPDRLEATYVPADVGFATKPKLATRMIARAIAASGPRLARIAPYLPSGKKPPDQAGR
jgi:SRSO17 transposase